MIRSHRLSMAVGMVATALGVVLVLVPTLGDQGVPTIVASLLTAGVGLLTLAVAVTLLSGDRERTFELPTPERRPTRPRVRSSLPGSVEDVAWTSRRTLAGDTGSGSPKTRAREQAVDELRDLAIDVLARTDGLTVEDAGDVIDDGRWTDDEAAAAFFADDVRPSLTLTRRLAGLLGADPPFVRRGRHVVAALTERIRGEAPDPDDRSTDPSTAVEASYWPPEGLETTRSTGRLTTLTVAALVGCVVGVFSGTPGLVLVATFPIALAATARLSSPSPDLSVTRSVDTVDPDPGETVTVTVTVRNDGETTAPDLRMLDGVPAGLTVADGSPRFGTALRPDGAATFSYEVTSVEGRHVFEPAVTIVGDFVGTTETIATVEVTDGPTVIDCGFETPASTATPPQRQVTVDPGLAEATARGTGTEFDSVREYRPGDPPSRIDWNHLAKVGTPSTIDFREPRLATVLLLVDTRPVAYVRSRSSTVPAVRHCALAAHTYGDRLLADGWPVGLSTTTPDDCWLEPAAGTDQRARLRSALAGTDAFPWNPAGDRRRPGDGAGDEASADVGSGGGNDVEAGVGSDGVDSPERVVDRITARLSPNVQVVFCTPLCDDDGLEIARRLSVAGHRITVLSLDCTDDRTVEAAYAGLQRYDRLSTLRRLDVPVYDWQPEERFAEVLARADGV